MKESPKDYDGGDTETGNGNGFPWLKLSELSRNWRKNGTKV